ISMNLKSVNPGEYSLVAVLSLAAGIVTGWLIVNAITLHPPENEEPVARALNRISHAPIVPITVKLDDVANASLSDLRRFWIDSLPEESAEFVPLLFARWVELDAHDALAFLDEL